MGEEAYDEIEIPSVGDMGDARTLILRGGYSRDEVYVGICRSSEDQPDEIIAVDGMRLRRALSRMVIGAGDTKPDRGWPRVRGDE